MFNNSDYSPKEKNAKILSNLSNFLNDNVIVVASVLSIFPDWQKWNRDNIKDYFEIYIKVSFEKLLKREVKSLYKNALNGKIKNVVGVDIEFPEPNSHLIIDNNDDDLNFERKKKVLYELKKIILKYDIFLLISLEILIYFSLIFKNLIGLYLLKMNYQIMILRHLKNFIIPLLIINLRMKTNTSGYGKGKNDKIQYNIDEYGSRKSIYDPKNAKIISIGDSYVFCRQVSDENTWQNKLSIKIDSAILNYGVGNYGIDQAILRIDNIFIPKQTKYMILGFVPETILRIQSYWKHYLEFGNTFAFKPKFILKKNKLLLINQYVDKSRNIKVQKKTFHL